MVGAALFSESENERLHQKLRELQPGPSMAGPALFVETGSASPPPPRLTRAGSARDIGTTTLVAVAVAAAAEATAEYQSSLVHVDADNETDPSVTLVTVRAPHRPYLMGDVSGAFSGLGLSVLRASIEVTATNSGRHACLRFALHDGGRKVTDRERLRAIEERVQQRFRGRQGLNGGIRRLVVERFLRAEPPWRHELLDAAESVSVAGDGGGGGDERWLAGLSESLRCAGALGGAVPSVLAARCATELLPEMVRMRVPPGVAVSNEQTAGEWLLLLEASATVRPYACDQARAPAVAAVPTMGAMMNGGHSPASRRFRGSPMGSPKLAAPSSPAHAAHAHRHPTDGGGAPAAPHVRVPSQTAASQLGGNERGAEPAVGHTVGLGAAYPAVHFGVGGAGCAATGGGGRGDSDRSDGSGSSGGGGGGGGSAVACTPSAGAREVAGSPAGRAADEAGQSMPAGTVLWELATPPPRGPSTAPHVDGPATGPATAAAPGVPCETLTGVERRPARPLPFPLPPARPLRWASVQAPSAGEGLILRACHLSAIQQKLVTLREAYAREHAHILADIPLFAPLSSSELLALCRRATVVDVPADLTLLPVPPTASPQPSPASSSSASSSASPHPASTPPPPASPNAATWAASAAHAPISLGAAAPGDPSATAAAEARSLVSSTTFGVVLSGGLQILLADDTEGRDAQAVASRDGGGSPPLPLAHLSPHETFGELGSPPPAGVVMRASPGGATLLCWPRDAILDDELGKLSLLEGGTSLLERCWQARSPLAFCLGQPTLRSLLRPMPLTEALRLEASGALQTEPLLVLVTAGEVLRHASADTAVDIALVRPDGGAEGRGAEGGGAEGGASSGGSAASQIHVRVTVRLPSRCHSLSTLSYQLADLGLTTRRATSQTIDGVVSDAFDVTLPIANGSSPAETLQSLRDRLPLLAATRMYPGDAVLGRAADGSSRLARLTPLGGSLPAVALIDLRALGMALVECDGEEAALWRRFLQCHAPHLLLPPSPPPPPPPPSPPPPEGERDGSLGAIAAAAASNGKAWHDVICAFLLYKVRQAAGEGEVGVWFRELELGHTLGEGGYGVVHLARHRVSGALYAVKSFRKSRIRRIEERRTFELLERERQTLKLLATADGRIPTGLTRLICTAHDAEWLRLVMPAYLGGDLANLLRQKGRAFSVESTQFYAGCLVLALQSLHAEGIAYRDLKPENVLLARDGWPVLTDFGLVAFTATEDGGEQPAFYIGSYSMATKASGTLVLIIEKHHASWDLMVTALPALEVHFRCQLRIDSARPILGPSGPCARVMVHVYVELM